MSGGLRVVATAVALTIGGSAGLAQSVESFYAGKTVKLIIGTANGGGYDLYGRFLARHIGKHIPGKPNVINVNIPGAASLNAANYLANVAPKDGTEILTIVQTLPLVQATRNDKVRFDLATFNWIGNMVTSPNVFISWRDSQVKSIADARERELIVGATGPTAIGYLYPSIVNKTLGTKFKIVLGYSNGEAADLAMERGEIAGRAGASWAMLKAARAHRLSEGEINVFLQVGLKKEKDLPDVPLLSELARNEKERNIFGFYSAMTAVSHAFTLGPGVPAERVAAMRRAFDAAMRDPELLAEARAINLEIDPLTGEDVQMSVTEMVRTDPAILMLDAASLATDERAPARP